jgi:hypothetical protein
VKYENKKKTKKHKPLVHSALCALTRGHKKKNNEANSRVKKKNYTPANELYQILIEDNRNIKENLNP